MSLEAQVQQSSGVRPLCPPTRVGRRWEPGGGGEPSWNARSFSEAEAARLLRVAQSTLHYWLDGGKRRGRSYKPVIRTEPRGDRAVAWAAFVEAGLLREYRRTHRVPMMELRAFIDLLRERACYPSQSVAPLSASLDLRAS
jgi:hypothetical protein